MMFSQFYAPGCRNKAEARLFEMMIAGQRFADEGVQNAICINHEPGVASLRERCRAFADALLGNFRSYSEGADDPIAARLLHLAISRRRESLADASGALLTRYPEGLASALEKISSYRAPMRRTSHATAHLFIANPFGGEAMKGFVNRLFMSHPPPEERIAALRGKG
jgi:hypothetical protein